MTIYQMPICHMLSWAKFLSQPMNCTREDIKIVECNPNLGAYVSIMKELKF
jgi:hypothetical protein